MLLECCPGSWGKGEGALLTVLLRITTFILPAPERAAAADGLPAIVDGLASPARIAGEARPDLCGESP